MRVRAWRQLLLDWARSFIGVPYAWGTSDCAALVRASWRIQFGVDVTRLPAWTTAAEALRIWLLATNSGEATFFRSLGATEVLRRTHGIWPVGTVLSCCQLHPPLPSFAIVIAPGVLLQSDQRRGVHTAESVAVHDLLGAWYIESAHG